jgi:hypothetical protein
MLIRMKTAIAGPTLSARAGQEIEFDDATAVRLIASDQADPVVRRAPETATAKKTENAALPRSRRA